MTRINGRVRGMFGGMYKEVFTKMFAVSKAGVCKMYEQVSQGVQLWLRLLTVGHVPRVGGRPPASSQM